MRELLPELLNKRDNTIPEDIIDDNTNEIDVDALIEEILNRIKEDNEDDSIIDEYGNIIINPPNSLGNSPIEEELKKEYSNHFVLNPMMASEIFAGK